MNNYKKQLYKAMKRKDMIELERAINEIVMETSNKDCEKRVLQNENVFIHGLSWKQITFSGDEK